MVLMEKSEQLTENYGIHGTAMYNFGALDLALNSQSTLYKTFFFVKSLSRTVFFL